MEAWKAEVMKRKISPSNTAAGARVASTAFLPDIQGAHFKSWEVLSMKVATTSDWRVLQSSDTVDALSSQPRAERKSAPPNTVYIQRDL